MKNIYKSVLTLLLFTVVSIPTFADGNAFTPLDFSDSYSNPKSTSAVNKQPSSTSNPLSNALSKIMPVKKDVADIDTASGETPIGNSNIQNAILELDNAQVGIRNDLLNYKAKYSDIDAQYKLIKNERAMLNKQITSIERRIRNIDRAKEKIRKNML